MSSSPTALQERSNSKTKPSHLPNVEPPSVADQVLAKLTALVEPEEGFRWLRTPQARLGGSPIDLIERGHADRVLRMLLRLEEGIHV